MNSSQGHAVPNMENADASPAKLIESIHALQNALDDFHPAKPIDVAHRKTWIALLSGLATSTFATFPSPDEVATWDVLKEKVALIDVTLDTLLKAVKNAPSIFAEQTETVRELFARLLQLEISLQAWLQVEVKDNQPDVASPQALEEKVVQTTIVLLRTIGHTLHMLSCSGDPSQGIRDALQESLDIVYGACAST